MDGCRTADPLNQSRTSQDLYTLAHPTKWGSLRRIKGEAILFDYVARNVEKGATVLEIGSGRGEFAEIARAQGFRYIGIEPSDLMREGLLARGFEILKDPIPEMDLHDESVGWVHSNAVIEHLEGYSKVMDYFREARRVLKKGGIISSVVPNCDSIGMIFYLYDYQHSFITNRNRLEHLLQDAGFDVIASRNFFTRIGFSSLALIDRIVAHTLLFVMRSPTVHSLVKLTVGNDLSFRIYKNLHDQTVVVGKKTPDDY